GADGVRPTFTSSDPTASFACQIDDQPFAPCVSGGRLAVVDGTHTLRVKAVDPAGNRSPVQASTFVLDTVAPHVRVLANPAARVNSRDAAIDFTSDEARSTFTCALDGAAPVPCVPGLKATGLADGAHHVEIRASDGVNTSAPAVVDWTVDTAA